MQLHTAPRVLKVQDAISDPIFPCNGALAGCWQATEFARMSLFGLLDFMHKKHMPKQLGQVVDDVVIGHSSETTKQLVDKVADMASDFKALSEQRKFPFSPGKVFIVASTLAVARQITEKLQSHNISDFVPSIHVRDVGVDHTSGNRRKVTIRNARLTKGKARLKRISGLAKINNKAASCAVTGALPSMLFGASAYGLPIQIIQGISQDVAAASGQTGVSACTTTRILSTFKMKGHPHYMYLKQLFLDFYDLWRSLTPKDRSDMLKHWMSFRGWAQNRASERWRAVRGIAGAMICSLFDIGWNPFSPLKLFDINGQAWQLDHDLLCTPGYLKVKLQPIFQAVQCTLEAVYWRQASTGHNGTGLQHPTAPGPDCRATNRLLQWLKRNSRIEEAQMLKTIQAGAFWGPARRATMANHEACPHGCGAMDPDDLHVFWTCPGLSSIDHPDVVSTQPLVPRAVEQKAIYPCLWLRGLLPSSFTTMPDKLPIDSFYFGASPAQRAESLAGELDIYSDASGTILEALGLTS